MIQSTGLTKVYRKGAPPAVLDLTYDLRPGLVTVLLGAEGAGKSTALRLMLELERGQGVTLFGGRTYRRLRRPEREVGVLLPGPGEGAAAVAGHPGHTARGHLRMLAAAVGAPARRADELLEQTRLSAVAGQRLRTFSPGMHRRLALAAALLGDPAALLLDAPTEGLSPRNIEWFHSFLRSFAVAGGTVLTTTRAPREAAQLADRVITLDQGRLVADQPVTEFSRTRLSPEVAVRGPQMARLADLLVSQGAEVRRDGSVGLAVAGLDRTEIGELAYRNGILLHELADRVVEQPAPRAALPVPSGRSGNLQVQPGAEEPLARELPQQPGESTAGEPGQALPVRELAQQAGGSAAKPGPALPVAPAPATGRGPRGPRAALTALGAAPRRGEATGARPGVAVDRLYREDPADPPRPARTLRRTSSADLLTDDTVRLARSTRPAPAGQSTPAVTPAEAPAEIPAEAPSGTPTAPSGTPTPTPDDHRSE
ncbi:ATP-binding cassette domain-containing protein [Kitasatospora sp. NPDC101183]|uniref:ATP-binding cassette domain-containing protein n=1 Tax=Kitasatospora sp. NPDC101183 TaxID=3364100 RepID=UPI003823B78B